MRGPARFQWRMVYWVVAFVGASVPALVFAQGTTERKIDPLALPLDKPDVWTLHFRYKPPRITTVDALDKDGRKVKKTVWYLWYQVYNRSGEPQTCLPEFELVTKDLNTTHLDEPQPYIFEQIKKFEDRTISPEKPNGYYNFQTSIGISRHPIPASKPDAVPQVVSGLAIWTDMAEKAPKTNKFAIYVTGLSNGLAVEETAAGEKLIKRKTLQINFLRPTDDKRPQVGDIIPDDINAPAEKWIYRTASSVKTKKQ
jgi:hypothetical protein